MGVVASQLVAKIAVEGDTQGKARLSSFGQAVDAASSRVKTSLAGSMRSAASSFLDFGAKLGQTVIGFKGLYDGAIGLGQALFSSNASMEQTATAFTTLLHSGTAAQKMMADLQQFAAETPFEFPEIANSARKMLAFGFSAQQIMPMLRNVGDAVSALGGGAFEIDRVTLALGQMKAKSKVSAEEMLQLTEVGIPAWDLLAKGMGKSTAEVMKLSERGLIPANQAIDILLAGMNKTFGGGMQAQSRTFIGLLSTFKDNVMSAWRAFTGPLFEQAKAGLQALGTLVSSPDFQRFATTLGQQVGTGLTTVINLIGRLSPLLSPLGRLFAEVAHGWQGIFGGEQGSSIPGIVAAFQRLQAAVRNFGTVIGPYVGPLISSFNSILTTLASNLTGLIAPALNVVTQRVNAFTAFLQPVMPALLSLSIAIQNLINAVGALVIPIASVIAKGGMLPLVFGLIGNMAALLVSTLAGLINALASVIRFFAENQIAAALLASAITTLAIAFAAFKIVSFVQGLLSILPVMYTLISMAIPSMIAGLGSMAVAAWAAITPFLPFIGIGLAVTAVIAGIILAIRNWGAITTWLRGIWQGFTAWFSGAMAVLSKLPVIGGIVQAFQNAWNTISSGAQSAWANIQAGAGTALDAIKARGGELGSWFGQRWASIQSGASTTGSVLSQIFQNAWNAIQKAWRQSPLSSAFNTMQAAFSKLGPVILQTLGQQLGPLGVLLSQTWTSMKTQVGAALSGIMPALANLGASFTQLWQSLRPLTILIGQGMLQAWKQLYPALVQVGAAIDGAFVTTWITLQTAMAAIGQAITTMLIPAWNTLTTALTPIIAMVGGAFVAVWGQLQQAFQIIAPLLMQVATIVGGALLTAWQAIWPVLVQVGQTLANVLMPHLPQIMMALQALAIVIGGVVLLAISLLLGAIVGLAQGLATFITGVASVITGIIQIFSGVVQVISGIIALIVDLCTGNFSKLGTDLGIIWNGIVTMFQGVWNIIKGLFTATVGTIISIVGGLVTTVVSFFTNLYNTLVGHSIIPDLVNGIIRWFQLLPGKIISFVTELVSRVVAFFNNLRVTAITTIGGLVQSLITFFTNLKNQAVQQAQALVTNFVAQLQQLPGKAVSAVSSLAGQLGSALAGVASQAAQWGRNVVQNIVNGINAMASSVASAASNIAGQIKSNLGFSSPTKEGPGSTADKWAPAFIKMYTQGLRAGIPQLHAAVSDLVKPLAVSLAPTSGFSALPSGVQALPPQTSLSPTIVVQVTSGDTIIDGYRLAGRLMPHLTQQIRESTGARF
jgi:tape measure domain-containing protein